MKFYQTILYFQHFSEHKILPIQVHYTLPISALSSFPTPELNISSTNLQKVSKIHILLAISIFILKVKEERKQAGREPVFSRCKTMGRRTGISFGDNISRSGRFVPKLLNQMDNGMD